MSNGRTILVVCVDAKLRTLSSSYCKALNANVTDTLISILFNDVILLVIFVNK